MNLLGHIAEFYDLFRSSLVEVEQSDRLELPEDHICHRGTSKSTERMLQSIGFDIVNTETNSFQVRFTNGSSLHSFWFCSGMGINRSRRRTPQIFETLGRNLNKVAADRGELALTIPIVCIEARKSDNMEVEAY